MENKPMPEKPESVFLSSLRTFFSSLSAILGIAVAFTIILIAIGLMNDSIETPESSKIKVAPDAEGSRKILMGSTPVLLKLCVQGVIGMEQGITQKKFENLLLDSQEGVLKGRIKGILLYVNTPGGTVSDSDGIYRALLSYKEKYKVPIYVFVDGLCASGGMYVSSAADRIYATETSVIGSVGVIGGTSFNLYDAMQKLGISALTLSQGKDKDMLNPFRPWRPGEEQSLKDVLQAMYENFVNIVVTGRPAMNKQKLINQYGANVFIAAEAKDLGYIDEANGSYSLAVHDLAKAVGITGKYQVVQLEPTTSLLSQLAQGGHALFKGRIEHTFPSAIPQELAHQFLYLFQP